MRVTDPRTSTDSGFRAAWGIGAFVVVLGYRRGARVMEPPKPYIIDGNRPQHHAVST
jgi:hypothetical protein